MRGSRGSLLMIIPNTKRHPSNMKTDQLPISDVITGLPRPYHHMMELVQVKQRNLVARPNYVLFQKTGNNTSEGTLGPDGTGSS